jgi:hypothetical protein
LSENRGQTADLPTWWFQPFSWSTSAIVAAFNGITPLLPGKPEEVSEIPAMLTDVWLRPVNVEARVGEHSAVVWNWVKRNPLSTIRCIFGTLTRPP